MTYYSFTGGVLLGVLVASAIIQPAYAGLTPDRVVDIGKSITVKIITSTGQGSGVLVRVRNGIYTVLTAYHLVEGQQSVEIEVMTPDGRGYKAVNKSIKQLGKLNVAMLQFSSERKYNCAVVVDSQKLRVGEVVYVVGFSAPTISIKKSELTVTYGKVTILPNQTGDYRYQIAYSKLPLNGMDGGAILSENGDFIGIYGNSETLNDTELGDTSAILSSSFIPLLGNVSTRYEDFIASGLAKYQDLNNQGAISDFSEAIRLKPDEALPYMMRGMLVALSGDKQGAIADLSEAIRLKPKEAQFYTVRGLLRSQAGDKQGGIEDLYKARQLAELSRQEVVESSHKSGNESFYQNSLRIIDMQLDYIQRQIDLIK